VEHFNKIVKFFSAAGFFGLTEFPAAADHFAEQWDGQSVRFHTSPELIEVKFQQVLK
jgi:hypothetical protein